ncbi:MAG: MATE family efflux transporter [Candidatus Woesearchaeota archaeon]
MAKDQKNDRTSSNNINNSSKQLPNKHLSQNVQFFIKNPKQGLRKVAWPIFISMFVHTLYNVVDTAFVGRLGPEALAALTFSFPFFFLMLSLNIGLVVGLTSLMAKKIGAKQYHQAQVVFYHGLGISALLSIGVFIGFFFGMKSFFVFLGASGTVLALALDYFSILVFGVFFMYTASAFNALFASQGNTKVPMKIQVSMLLLNIVLDPLFIYGFKLGVKGAALATLIALFGSVLLYWYYRKESSILLKKKTIPKTINTGVLGAIVKLGIPPTGEMIFFSLYIALLNKLFAVFSVHHVAMFGVVSRLESVAMLPLVALSQGSLTLLGMYYGAKRFDKVQYLSTYAVRLGLGISATIGLIFFLFPGFFLSLFSADSQLRSLGIPYLMINVFTFPFIAISMIFSRTLLALGHGMPGLIVSVVRNGLIIIPLSYILVLIVEASYLVIAAAMVAGAAFAAYLAWAFRRHYFKKIAKTLENKQH